jgi:hypothetical protein
VHPVVGVRGLRVEALKLVWRVGDLAVGGSLVRQTGSAPAQSLVGVVEVPTDASQALVAVVVEPPLRLGPPERVLLGDQLLDLIQDGLLVHEASIVSGRRARRKPQG